MIHSALVPGGNTFQTGITNFSSVSLWLEGISHHTLYCQTLPLFYLIRFHFYVWELTLASFRIVSRITVVWCSGCLRRISWSIFVGFSGIMLPGVKSGTKGLKEWRFFLFLIFKDDRQQDYQVFSGPYDWSHIWKKYYQDFFDSIKTVMYILFIWINPAYHQK